VSPGGAHPLLAGHGLNLRAVFDIAALPLQRLGACRLASRIAVPGRHQRGLGLVVRLPRRGAADTALAPTPKADWGAACADCAAKSCINACPAGALAAGTLDLAACVDCRLQEGSHCNRQCLARIVCPVGAEHRYTKDQIRYHYGRSLITLKAWREKTLDCPPTVT
jgi:ferredoxin-like protein FixX